MLNLTIPLFRELAAIKIRISIEFIMKKKEGYSSHKVLLMNQTMDLCGLLKSRGSNWQAKLMFGELDKYPGLPHSCPIKPATFVLNRVTYNLNFIPIRPVPELKFFLVFDFFTSINKRRTSLSYAKIEGMIKDTVWRNDDNEAAINKLLGMQNT